MSKPLPINLALQGGGSHGALAWGVLDRLLEEPRLRFGAVSGTSAGAMNAVVLAHGLETGGRESARTALFEFWKAVSDAARFSPLQPTLLDQMRGRSSLAASPGYLALEWLSQIFSPYQLNPFNINPLRRLIERMVDFDAVNRSQIVQVHLTATNVRTGQARIFSTGEITADALMASACLPQLYQAVEIDGDGYWDGGFAANPALQPLVMQDDPGDLLIVQLNPIQREKLPYTARDIMDRVNEISFNTSLLKELRALNVYGKLIDENKTEQPRGTLRLHMIHGEADVERLSASSKLNADWRFLQKLFHRGRIWADVWLEDHLDDVGKRPSLHLDELFVHSPDPARVTALSA